MEREYRTITLSKRRASENGKSEKQFRFEMTFQLLLLLFASLAHNAAALPPGMGAMTVTVDKTTYSTDDVVMVTLAIDTTSNGTIPADDTMLQLVVRKCDAVIASSCSDDKYKQWKTQPFATLAPSEVMMCRKRPRLVFCVSTEKHVFDALRPSVFCVARPPADVENGHDRQHVAVVDLLRLGRVDQVRQDWSGEQLSWIRASATHTRSTRALRPQANSTFTACRCDSPSRTPKAIFTFGPF